jgi:hypothetical protein
MNKRVENLLKKNKATYVLGKFTNIVIYNILYDSVRYSRYLLSKHNIIKNHKFDKIKQFKNIHAGARCFIVATGPSLTYDDLVKIKNEFSFGVNSVVKAFDKTKWRPTYYGIQDANVYEKLEQDILHSGFKDIFISHRLCGNSSLPPNFTQYFHFSCFHSRHSDILPLTSGFSDDASEIVYDGYSVTYSMLQIAVYMGFKKIYLMGTDCNYDMKGKQHFEESGWVDKTASTVGERMIYAFTVAKKFADKNDIHIFNASRGGMLDVFERVNLDDVL